ncbi:MAG: GNAT family N-acetyltransferase [Candidatus Poribacteria bacterium]|nr:GNAT family N-acetyltransferase [Candidatus Poribacteria bacterium]
MPAKPQLLRMRRPNFEELPAWRSIALPQGYALRDFQPGDEKPWSAIMEEGMSPQWNLAHAQKAFFGTPEFAPENVFFMTWQGEPIGSASAWPESPDAPETGRVHMVGVRSEHRGQGLGYLLTLRVLHRMHQCGFRDAVLNTHDSRLPAIRIYLKLDFVPVYVVPEHKNRWEKVLAAIGLGCN